MERLAPPLPFNFGPHLLGVRTLTRLASWPWMLCFPGLCTGCPIVPLWPIPAPQPYSVVKGQVRVQASDFPSSTLTLLPLPGWGKRPVLPCAPRVDAAEVRAQLWPLSAADLVSLKWKCCSNNTASGHYRYMHTHTCTHTHTLTPDSTDLVATGGPKVSWGRQDVH